MRISELKNHLAGLTVVMLLSVAPQARAQLVAGTTFDFSGDANSAVQTVQKQLTAVEEGVVAEVKKGVTEVKAMADKYAGKLTKVMSKVPGSKDFDEGSSVDIYSAEAVEEAFRELFLQYPSDDERINKAYEQKALQFYYDTLVEMKTSIIELEAQLSNLRKDVEKFGEEATAGGGDAADPEDENAVAYNAYMANRKFNDILKITEQLVAMQNQYLAARQLRQPRTVIPAPKGSSSGKTSLIMSHQRLGFAQMMQNSAFKGISSQVKTKAQAAKELKKELKIDTAFSAAKTAAESVEDKNASAPISSHRAVIPTSNIRSEFVDAKAPKAASLLSGSETQIKALGIIADTQKYVNEAMEAHNLLQRMPTYKDVYTQYRLYTELRAKAVEAIKTSDQCVIQYIGRRYDEPNMVWFGQSTPPKDPGDYDSRKGLSGWAISAYQVANASVGNEFDLDAFGEVEIDTSKDSDRLTEVDYDPVDTSSGSDDDVLANPSRAQAFSDSVREVELLNWQIGRKAAQILVEDQNSQKPIYGKPAHPYPLWNDQRAYYDQYLENKYNNMKNYIDGIEVNLLALEIAKKINSGNPIAVDKKKINAGLALIEDALGGNTSSSSSSTGLLAAKASALASIKAKQAAAILPYKTSNTALNTQLDAWAAMIGDVTQKINTADGERALNESKVENARREIEALNARGTNTSSSTYTMAKLTLEEAGNLQATKITELGQLRAKLKQYEQNRDSVRAKIEANNDKINTLNQKYQEDITAIETEYNDKLQALQDAIDSAPKLAGIYKALKLDDGDVLDMVKKADSLIDRARSCAAGLISDHYEDVMKMSENDELYMTYNNPKIVKMHTDLVGKLKDLPKTCFNHDVAVAIGTFNVGSSGIVSMLTTAFKTTLNKSVCSEYTCDAADEQYFAGLPAKARDFTAPKAPLTAHYPTVRDMVHFDTTDYRNLEKGSDGKLTSTAFLEYGVSQPYVWQLLLSDKAYVERGADLGRILEKGGEVKAYMRGIILPCKVGSYMIDMDNSGKYSIVNTQKQFSAENLQKLKSLQTCKDLTIAGHTVGIGNILETYIIYDRDVKGSVKANAAGEINEPVSSELGMFLRYKKGRLLLNDRPHEGFEKLIAKEEKAQKTGKYELSAEENTYQRAMFTTNQIGDFLHFVDKENQIDKNLTELKGSIDDFVESLRETFGKMGFTLKDNLDLSRDDDYNYVLRKLQERKNTMMGQVQSELSRVNYNDETVKERYDKINNTYKAMIQDSQALVSVTANTKSGSPLTEKIRSEQANQKVIAKARNEGYASIRKEIDEYEQPVCMPY